MWFYLILRKRTIGRMWIERWDRRGGMSGCLRRPDERSFYGNGETEADELGEGIVRRDVSGCCGRGLGGELPEEGAEWG